MELLVAIIIKKKKSWTTYRISSAGKQSTRGDTIDEGIVSSDQLI
jgi:hypothetical protein